MATKSAKNTGGMDARGAYGRPEQFLRGYCPFVLLVANLIGGIDRG